MKALLHTLLTIFISFSITQVYGQDLSKKMKVPYVDGAILDMVQQGDTMFIAGTFSHMLHADSAETVLMLMDSSCSKLQNLGISGFLNDFTINIRDIIPDGKGGWYICGSFRNIGDSARNGLAHLDSLGRLTGKFSNSQFNEVPDKLKLHGDTLLVAGHFKSFGTSHMNFGMASIYPDSILFKSPYNDVPEHIVADDEGGFYVTGLFYTYGDSIRRGIAHIDSNGIVTERLKGLKIGSSPIGKAGNVLAKLCQSYSRVVEEGTLYNPDLTVKAGPEADLPNGSVSCYAENPDKSYFIGGYFQTVGKIKKNSIALLDSNHQVTSWECDIKNFYVVNQLVVYGDYLFIAASVYDSATHTWSNNSLFKVEIASGAVLSVQKFGLGKIGRLLARNGRLYIFTLGQETTFLPSSQRALYVSIFDIHSDKRIGKRVIQAQGSIDRIEFSKDYLFVLGNFASIEGSNRAGFAQFGLDDFQLTSTNIGSAIGTNIDFVVGDSQIYFMNYHNGSSAPHQGNGLCYNFKNATWTNWNLTFNPTGKSSNEKQMKIVDAGIIIYNPILDSINGIPCDPLVLLDRNSGNLIRTVAVSDLRYPMMVSTHTINLFDNEDNTFENGDYYEILFFDSKSGIRKDTTVFIGAQNNVTRITGFGDKFIVEGTFNSANKLPVPGRFIVDTLGNIIPFNFSKITGKIESMALYDTVLFIAGSITCPGAPGYGLFAFGLSGQQLIPNFPVLNGYVKELLIDSNNLYILGSYTMIDTFKRKYLASVRLSDYSINSLNPRFDFIHPSPNSMAVGGGIVHLFGDFEAITYNGSRHYRQHYVGITISNDSIYKKNLLLSRHTSLVKGVCSKNQLMIKGTEVFYGDDPCPYVAALNVNTEELINWMPEPDQNVFDIAIAGNTIVLGGSFTSLKGSGRPFLAFFDGLVAHPRPNTASLNNGIAELVSCPSGIFAVGYFTSVQNKPRNKIAMFNPSTGLVTDWLGTGLTNNGHSYAIKDSSIYFINKNRVLMRYDTGQRVEKVLAAKNAYSFELQDSGFIGSGNYLFTNPKGNAPIVRGNHDSVTSAYFGLRSNLYNRIVRSGNQYLVQGSTVSSGVFTGNVGAFRISTGEPIPLGIHADDSVFKIRVHENKLLLFGKFDEVNDSSRKNFALYDLSSRKINSWKIKASAYSFQSAYSMALYKDQVIFGNGLRLTDSLGIVHDSVVIVDDTLGSTFKTFPGGKLWAGPFYQKDSIIYFVGGRASIQNENKLFAYNLKKDSLVALSQDLPYQAAKGFTLYVNDSFVFYGYKGPASYNSDVFQIINWHTRTVMPQHLPFNGFQYEHRITSINAHRGKVYLSYVNRNMNPTYPQLSIIRSTHCLDEYTLDEIPRTEMFNLRVYEIFPTDYGVAFGGEFYEGSHSNTKYLQSIKETPRLFFTLDQYIFCGSPDTLLANFELEYQAADSLQYSFDLFKEDNGTQQWVQSADLLLPYQNENVKLAFHSLAAGTYVVRLSLKNHPDIQAVFRDFVIQPLPLARIASSNSLSQCHSGNQFVLLDSSSASVPYHRFWSSSDSLTDTSSQIVYSRTTVGTTNWQLILMDSNSCTDTGHVDLETFPEPDFSIKTLRSADVCIGDSILLETDSLNTSWIYSLTKDGNTIDSNSSGQFWIHDSSTYRIEARTPQGCSTMSAPVKINIHPIPPTPIIIGPDSIIGLDTNIYTTLTDTGLSYFWNSQGITFNTRNDTLMAVWIYEGHDTLSLFVENQRGCKSEKAYHILFIDMIPDSLLLSHDTLFANPYGDTLKMYVVSNLAWSIVATPGWANFDKNSGTGIDSVQVIFAPNSGTVIRDYQVVFEADTLSDTLVLVQGTYLNLANFVFREINMYPNPAFSELQIINQSFEAVRIRIRNASGALIQENSLSENGHLVLEVEDWKSGLYLVEIENSKGREYRKLLIVH